MDKIWYQSKEAWVSFLINFFVGQVKGKTSLYKNWSPLWDDREVSWYHLLTQVAFIPVADYQRQEAWPNCWPKIIGLEERLNIKFATPNTLLASPTHLHFTRWLPLRIWTEQVHLLNSNESLILLAQALNSNYLFRMYYIQGVVLSTLHAWFPLILSTFLWGRYYLSLFTNQEIGSKRWTYLPKVTVMEPEFDSKSSNTYASAHF